MLLNGSGELIEGTIVLTNKCSDGSLATSGPMGSHCKRKSINKYPKNVPRCHANLPNQPAEASHQWKQMAKDPAIAKTLVLYSLTRQHRHEFC